MTNPYDKVESFDSVTTANKGLLRKLAEIEGRDAEAVPQIAETDDSWHYWNPLTSWSDCGPLIEKYKLIISPMLEGVFEPWHVGYQREYSSFYGYEHDPDLKTAICLAVVAAHEAAQLTIGK